MSNTKLPDPKYLYHFNPSTGEDDLFEFASSGAIDEGCKYCERLYTAEQMHAYALADRERQAGEAVEYATERLTELAKPIATAIAKNCSVAPQLVFPHLLLGLKDLFASLPARQAVQAGWRLVPVEPTEDMMFAAEMSELRGYRALYRAMTIAAPSPDGKAERMDGVLAFIRADAELARGGKAEQAEAPGTASNADCGTCEGDPDRCDIHDCGDAHKVPTASNAGEREAHAVELYDALESLMHEMEKIPDGALPDSFNGRVVRYAKDALARRPTRAALASKPPAGEQKPIGFMSEQQIPAIKDQDGEGGCYIPMRKTPAGLFRFALYGAPQPEQVAQDLDAIPTNWELSWGVLDEDDECSPVGWRVHRVSGGRNDREWEMIGTGNTPTEAIRAARARGEGERNA